MSYTIRGRISLHRPTPPTPAPTLRPTPAPLCVPNIFKLFKGYLDNGKLDPTAVSTLRLRLPCRKVFLRFLVSNNPRACLPSPFGTMDANATSDANITSDANATSIGSPELQVLQDVFYRYVMPVLIITGVLTNVINILTLWKVNQLQKHQQNRQAQTTTYRYLFWLAIADMLASLSLVPAIVFLEREELPYGWAFYYAHFETPLMNGLTSASVYIVVGLSVDRYIAVCHPRRYVEISAPRLAAIRIVCSFLVPVVLYFPQGFFLEVVCAVSGAGWTYQSNQTNESAKEHYELFVELCHRIFPAIILAVLNGCIIYTFHKTTAKRNQMRSKPLVSMQPSSASKGSEDQSRRHQEKRLVYLLVAIVVSFLATTLPAAVLALSDIDGPTYGYFGLEVFRAIANCLEAFGLSLNFVLYFVFVSSVREVLKKAVCGLAAHAKVDRGCSHSSTTNSKNTECVEL
ncbi:probable G-protein coupled receptor AH9.1 isoform X2 [Penaeus chinensis]|uniref:probable G-protein coupled receptor AH9.1 isoform X2 n=1 Tax=Penaeus chinensis TaxID=139456 RepID=UPI001FB68F1F|nr:probable G-protein coupled receptor AH9.1 isoform X2 [Penaeus chinensis]